MVLVNINYNFVMEHFYNIVNVFGVIRKKRNEEISRFFTNTLKHIRKLFWETSDSAPKKHFK